MAWGERREIECSQNDNNSVICSLKKGDRNAIVEGVRNPDTNTMSLKKIEGDKKLVRELLHDIGELSSIGLGEH